MIHTENAFAKINLFLDVIQKRPDGYHDIGILFQTIDACDHLQAREIADNSVVLRYSVPQDYPVESDLVYRAAVALRNRFSVTKGVELYLEKVLPMGAGLGGGSADAAATLRLLNRMWSLGASAAELCEIGAKLGADVPFLVEGGTALATGIGEILEPIAAPELPSGCVLAVATPLCAVPTKAAYAGIIPSGGEQYGQFENKVRKMGVKPLDEEFDLYNKFEESVFPQYPQIASLKQKFMDFGGLRALMSGSGASVFCFFGSENEAKRALEGVNKDIRWSTVARFQHCY